MYNDDNEAKDNNIKEEFPICDQTLWLFSIFFFVMYVCTYSCYAWVRLEWTGRIGQMNIAAYFVRFGLIKSKRVTVWMES